MRFLDFNYADPNNAVTVTGTSESTQFPATNLGKHSPSRVWRSSGNFVIDSTNNKINFKESGGGAELTATVTSGNYSPAALMSAIDSAMDTASTLSRTYTTTYSSLTGKWTIVEDSSTYLDILFDTGTDAASSIRDAIGFGTNDFTGATSYTGPSVAIHTEEGVVFDLNTTEAIDSVVVLFSALDGIKLSTAATISIQANATNVWTSPAVDQALTIDDAFSSATHFFTTDQSYRYWRIKVVDTRNADLFVELGGVILAKGTTLTDAPESGFKFSITDQSKQQENEFGTQVVDELPFRKSISFNYAALQYTDIKTLERMFRRNGVRTPVCVVLDETEACFDKDHFLVWGKFQKTLTHNHINFNLFTEDLTVREIL